MIPASARELVRIRVQLASGYPRHAVHPIPDEPGPDRGQSDLDGSVRELGLRSAFGQEPGTDFSGVGRPSAVPAPFNPTQS